MSEKSKKLLVTAAALEFCLLCLFILLVAPLVAQALAAIALTLGLLVSIRYLWQRLSGRDAQFGNLLVAATVEWNEVDRWMVIAHVVFACVGWVLILAYS